MPLWCSFSDSSVGVAAGMAVGRWIASGWIGVPGSGGRWEIGVVLTVLSTLGVSVWYHTHALRDARMIIPRVIVASHQPRLLLCGRCCLGGAGLGGVSGGGVSGSTATARCQSSAVGRRGSPVLDGGGEYAWLWGLLFKLVPFHLLIDMRQNSPEQYPNNMIATVPKHAIRQPQPHPLS